MNEWDDSTDGGSDFGSTRTKQRSRIGFPDPLGLIFGLVALVASAYALSDGAFGLSGIDPRWLFAGGALVIGLLMLGASIRPSRRRDE